MIRNKKAQFNVISDTASMIHVMFAFILVAIIVSMILISFFQNTSEFSVFSTPALQGVMLKMQEFPIMMDWGTLLLFGITWISALWMLSRVEVENALYIVAWVGMIALSVASIGVGYALDILVNSPLLSDAVQYMVFIPFYASNAFLFTLLFFCSGLIALHAPTQ